MIIKINMIDKKKKKETKESKQSYKSWFRQKTPKSEL